MCIRKTWNFPIQVYVELDDNGLTLSSSIDEFFQACVEEVGNPTMILTKSALLSKLNAAAERVRLDLQKSSIEVIV